MPKYVAKDTRKFRIFIPALELHPQTFQFPGHDIYKNDVNE